MLITDEAAIKRCSELDLINEKHLRNYNIRREYKELTDGGMTGVNAAKFLAEKYNLSPNSITNNIIYK